MAEKKVERMYHALHLRRAMAIVTSSVCSSSGPTVVRPASVHDGGTAGRYYYRGTQRA